MNKKYFEIAFSRDKEIVKVDLCNFNNLEEAVGFCRLQLKFFDYDSIFIKPISLD